MYYINQSIPIGFYLGSILGLIIGIILGFIFHFLYDHWKYEYIDEDEK